MQNKNDRLEASLLYQIRENIEKDSLVRLFKKEITLSRDTATVESRFLEPPRETKIGSKNREIEISGVKLQ